MDSPLDMDAFIPRDSQLKSNQVGKIVEGIKANRCNFCYCIGHFNHFCRLGRKFHVQSKMDRRENPLSSQEKNYIIIRVVHASERSNERKVCFFIQNHFFE